MLLGHVFTSISRESLLHYLSSSCDHCSFFGKLAKEGAFSRFQSRTSQLDVTKSSPWSFKCLDINNNFLN